MSKKIIALSVALVGILLVSTLFYSRAGRTRSSAMDPSITIPVDMD